MLTSLKSKLQTLKSHQGFRRYAANTSWMMAEQILRMIAGLFVGIWVARYLGPEQFGLFSYAIAFTAIFGGIAKLGLDGILVRELVNYPERRDVYLGTAFWLKVMGAFLVMALMAVVVPFTSNDSTTNLFIFIIASGLVFQSFEVVEFYFQSRVLAKVVSVCKTIQLALSSVLKIILVVNDAELIWFVCVTAFDAVSLALSYLVAYKLRKERTFYRFFNIQVASSLLKDSWPLIFSSLVVMIYMRIDQVMIREMLGNRDVGIYSAAVKLSEAFYFLPTIICASVFPAILAAKKKSPELYKVRIKRLYVILVWGSFGVIAIILLVSGWLITSLLGDEFLEASNILKIHAWSIVFVSLGVASSRWLYAENLSAIALYRTSLGALINIVLNFFLIPRSGIEGAAIATLISQSFAALFYDFFDPRMRDQFLIKLKAFIGSYK